MTLSSSLSCSYIACYILANSFLSITISFLYKSMLDVQSRIDGYLLDTTYSVVLQLLMFSLLGTCAVEGRGAKADLISELPGAAL